MTKHLTAEQVARYRQDGFLSPVTVLSPAEAAACRAELEALEGRHGRLNYKLKPHLFCRLAARLVRHPAILDALEALVGPDLLLFDSAFIIKEPGDGKRVSWHQDLTYWGLEPAAVTSVWLALSPATAASGAMRMLPGSHRRGPLSHEETFAADNLLSRGQTISQGIDEGEAVQTHLEPGQMSLHDGWTCHDSGPNHAADRRIGFNMNVVTPAARQLRFAGDSALLLRGQDHFGHWRPERPAEADFDPADLAFQAEIAALRGQSVNLDRSGRLAGAQVTGA